MRPLLTAILVALLATPSAALAADSAATAFAFPATPAGRHAQAWFAAYASGDDAVRAFFGSHASAEALTQRPIEQRMQFLQRVRGDMGALTPVKVSESSDEECKVLARSEKGGALLVSFLCAPDAEHTLGGMRFEPVDAEPGPPAAPAETGPPPTDAQIAAAFGAQLDSLAHIGEFSGAALLDKGGATLFARATGMASRQQKRANTLETRFNLGSLNKIFTHVAIEQLAQAGKLSLDDTLTRFLPDYRVANANRITLRMLLAHRGGVPDMLMSPVLREHPDRVRTMADWYALVREMPLRFEPGAKQEYSNGGFVLLGQVIASASGEDYYEYMRKHIYAPAGMTRSDHFAPDNRLSDIAVGYTGDGDASGAGVGADTLGGLVPNTGILPGRGSSAGGGYSTVGDLVRFAHALRAGKLLDAAHVSDIFGEKFSLGIAGGSPGVNGLFVVAGPYTLVALANLDPPAAEQFAPTIGRMTRRAAGLPPPPARR